MGILYSLEIGLLYRLIPEMTRSHETLARTGLQVTRCGIGSDRHCMTTLRLARQAMNKADTGPRHPL